MKLVEADGLRVAYTTAGGGPVHVLFVHGLGADRSCWCRAPAHFSPDRYTLVFPDLPGFGDSGAGAASSCSMEVLTDGLELVLEALGNPPFHLVSHSMGCIPSLLLSERHAGSVVTFATAEGNLGLDDAAMSGRIARLTEAEFVRAFPKWLRVLEATLGREAPEQNALFLRAVAKVHPACLHRAAKACVASSATGELRRRFSELGCPRAYVVGELTRERRESMVPDDVDGFLSVSRQGHFPMEAAADFYRWIRDWIEAASGSRTARPRST